MDINQYRRRILFSRLPRLIFYVASFGYVFVKYFLSKNIIIVMSAGKVGSGSLYYHLKSLGKQNVLHIHYLSLTRIKDEFSLERSSQRRSAPWHLYVSFWLSLFLRFMPRKEIKIVFLIRDCGPRYLSSVFQNIGRLEKEYFDLQYGMINEKKILDFIYNGVDKDISSMRHYLNTELQVFLGMDLKSLRVNSFVSTRFGSALCANLNDVESLELLGDYLGVNCIDIRRTNVGSSKFYSVEYEKIQKIAIQKIRPLYIEINHMFGIVK